MLLLCWGPGGRPWQCVSSDPLEAECPDIRTKVSRGTCVAGSTPWQQQGFKDKSPSAMARIRMLLPAPLLSLSKSACARGKDKGHLPLMTQPFPSSCASSSASPASQGIGVTRKNLLYLCLSDLNSTQIWLLPWLLALRWPFAPLYFCLHK